MAFRRIRKTSAVPKVQQRLTPLKSLRQKDGKRLPPHPRAFPRAASDFVFLILLQNAP